MTLSYHVYVSERGNVFMKEIAAVLAAALGDLGYETVFPSPGLPERHGDRVNLVVAPHEFFPLQREHPRDALLRAADASVCVGVEQPGTEWFELGSEYAARGPLALDISRYAAAELSRRGLQAVHLQLGYHPSWDLWGGRPRSLRPTDVLFLGSLTDRRERLLSEAAGLLWDARVDWRLFEFPRPMTTPRARFVAGADKWELLATSRMLLNIHRNDVPYLEWVRVLEAVTNGCLVLTEVSTDYGPFLPGEHLVALPAEALAASASSFLLDEELRTDITTNAYEFLRSKLELTALLTPICSLLEDHRYRTSPSRTSFTSQQPTGAPPAPSRSPFLETVLDTERKVHARVKELLDGETQLIQAVEALQSRLAHGDPDHVDITTTRAWESSQPTVSVVLTSYNYADYVLDAIESVAASVGVEPELVIVDDHSQDDSVDRLARWLQANASFPAMLVARAANAGVSVARNVGISHARAGLIFVLDADNFVFPTTLSKLSRALSEDPDAAFAYGIIAKRGEPGLLSHLPWMVERLTHSNYIDAMALIRRSTLSQVGLYDGQLSLQGWEDYELWLRVAAAGLTGAFVPEPVGIYRVHSTSRQQTVNLDTAPLALEFRNRYPFLPWPPEPSDGSF